MTEKRDFCTLLFVARFLVNFFVVMFNLKLEVSAYDCFRRIMMQSWRLRRRHWIIYFIIYILDVLFFIFQKLMLLFDFCFCVEAIGTFFKGNQLFYTLPYQ